MKGGTGVKLKKQPAAVENKTGGKKKNYSNNSSSNSSNNSSSNSSNISSEGSSNISNSSAGSSSKSNHSSSSSSSSSNGRAPIKSTAADSDSKRTHIMRKKLLKKLAEMKKKMRPATIYRPNIKFMSNGKPVKMHMMKKSPPPMAEAGVTKTRGGGGGGAAATKIASSAAGQTAASAVSAGNSPVSTMQMKSNGRPHSIYKLRKENLAIEINPCFKKLFDHNYDNIDMKREIRFLNKLIRKTQTFIKGTKI